MASNATSYLRVNSWSNELVVRQLPSSKDVNRGHCWDLLPSNGYEDMGDLAWAVVRSRGRKLVRAL
jgi:hypothetical protein